MLPAGCGMSVVDVLEYVAKRCDGLCSLKCGNAEYVDAPAFFEGDTTGSFSVT